jgi:hypothetical protein
MAADYNGAGKNCTEKSAVRAGESIERFLRLATSYAAKIVWLNLPPAIVNVFQK